MQIKAYFGVADRMDCNDFVSFAPFPMMRAGPRKSFNRKGYHVAEAAGIRS